MNGTGCSHQRLALWLNLILGTLAVSGAVLIFLAGWRQRGLSAHPVPATPIPSVDVRCGPNSLRTASLRLGIPFPSDEMLAIPVHPALGASIGDLKGAAIRQGLEATSTTIGFDHLKNHRGTAILLINNNHFVAVDPRESSPPDGDRKLRVYDPGKLAVWWSRTELEKAWQGETLLLSREHSDAPAPGDEAIVWDHCWKDAGLVDDPDAAQFQFPVTNGGSTPLEIGIDGTSCNCTSAKVSPERLLPGESGVVTAAVSLIRQPGHFSETVRVRSSDPGAPLTELVLSGSSLNNVVSARSVHFGSIYPGEEAVKHLLISDRGDGRLEVASAEWLPQVAPTVLPSVAAMVKTTRVRPGDKWNGRISPALRPSPDDSVVEIAVRAAEESIDGKFAGQIEIVTNLPAPWTRFTVLAEGIVASPLAAEPAALTVSARVPGSETQRITISHKSGKEVTLARVSAKGELPLEVQIIEEAGARAVVEVRCEHPETKRTMTGVVACELDSGGTIDVPVIFIPVSQP